MFASLKLAACLVAVCLIAVSCGGDADAGAAAAATTTTPVAAEPTSTGDVAETTSTSATPADPADTAAADTSTTVAAEDADAGEVDADCPVWAGETGTQSRSFEHEGIDRNYVVHVPNDVDVAEPMPVVFNFHGLGGRGESQMASTGFMDLADRDGWLVVAPDGVLNPRRWPIEGIDADGPASLDFVDGLIEQIGSSWCIDRSRLYATGFSYGGIMTSALACQRSTTFAAFAPAGATVYPSGFCDDAEPLSLVSFHGTADQVVSFDGSPTLLDQDGFVGDIGENVASWAAQSGCDPEPEESVAVDPTTLRSWSCPTGIEIGFYVTAGGAHTWPRPGDAGIDGTELIWDFFARHRLG